MNLPLVCTLLCLPTAPQDQDAPMPEPETYAFEWVSDWTQLEGCSAHPVVPPGGEKYTFVQEAHRVRPGVHWGTTGRRAPAPLDTPGAFT